MYMVHTICRYYCGYIRSNAIKKLSCVTTCTLSDIPTYIWYKNGHVIYENKKVMNVNSLNAGSYSCAVKGHEDLRSPAVCHFDPKKCWSVTYSSQTICSVIGSSVDIHSYYTFPNYHKVTSKFWFVKEQVNIEPVDMIEDETYQGRVQYTHSSLNNCSLRITNLRETDAQTYTFRFFTDWDKFMGEPGVLLSVTDLKVIVQSDWSDQNIQLSCNTTCTLSHNTIYIWYKNEQRVPECKSASCSVAADSGEVSYSCAVEPHESFRSPPVYSPTNTKAVVISSGDTVEGDSVTMSCSSDANPPVLIYTWFKREDPDILLTSNQKFNISNLSKQHSGFYYCTAYNQLGRHNATPVHLDVLYAPRNTSLSVASGDLPTLSCSSDSNPISSYTWYGKTQGGVTLTGNGAKLTLSSQSLYKLYYCTAENRLGASNSSEWAHKSDNRVVTYAASAVTVASVVIFFAVFLWICRRRASGSSSRREECTKNNSPPVYGNISDSTSDPTQTTSSEVQDSVQYRSVYFSHSNAQEVPLYSTVQLPKVYSQKEEVEYATVSLVTYSDVREEEIYKNLKFQK
ncbi:sialoadhesin-like isoform X1 [Silurus meridionalis]|uniref:sialoadhesin-like isoform X1 n=2 Tax=Silurus meridionalis TaxID=175797 RepID=UPI001EEB142E|nr:sialoadhesin-like isoform X1 [Silurus meridionalis]